MNLVVLKGNLTKDPDVRDVSVSEKSTKVANFTIAVNNYFTRADGTKSKEVTFIDCEAWDSGASTINDLLSKGDPVLINGRLKTESWEKDGQKRSRMKVRVSSFEKLYRSNRPYEETADENESDSSPEPEVNSTDSPGEEIPF